MIKTIIQYQKVYNILIKRLKGNKKVLAVMVFGSMVSGDLWEESDIDFFVVIKDELKEIVDIYITENEIPVHIKLMSVEKFFYVHDNYIRGSFLHRILSSARLVFSKDFKISAKYDSLRYYPDVDREKWNLVYLGNLIKSLGLCKKYISIKSYYTAFTSGIKCAEEFARLYVNFSGYMINNDVINMAVNMNDKYKKCLDRLLSNSERDFSVIEAFILFMEESVNSNIKNITKILLKFMEEKKCPLSAAEIKNDKLFSSYDIKFQDILSKLYELNFIKKDKRDYKTSDGVTLITKENVYYL